MKKTAIKNGIPWIIAILIFIYLFKIYPPEKIWESLKHLQWVTFIPFAVGYFFFIYLVDAFAIQKIFRRFGFSIPIRELIPARGVTYLLMVLNFLAAQLGFAYYLKRAHRIPIWEALSVFFFITLIDLYWVLTLALIGSFFQDFSVGSVELKKFIWALAAIAYPLFILNYLFWRSSLFKKIEKSRWRLIQWITHKDIFRLFKQITWKDYLQMSILRIPIHLTIIVSMWVVMQTFDVYVPFLKILGNIPIVMLIGIIPITPGGLGTTNAAMVTLLSPYATGTLFEKTTITPAEILFAASLLWMFSNYLLKVIVGTLCLKKTSKALFTQPN